MYYKQRAEISLRSQAEKRQKISWNGGKISLEISLILEIQLIHLNFIAKYKPPLYISVTTRALIGQFSKPYSTDCAATLNFKLFLFPQWLVINRILLLAFLANKDWNLFVFFK